MAEVKDSSLLIKDLKPNMKRVCVIFIVLEIGSPVRIKDGNEVRTVKVADRTGCINMSVWNEKGNLIAPGDIIQLTQGNTTVRNGCLTLNVGRYGELVKTGEFCLLFSEQPDCSAYNENWVKLLRSSYLLSGSTTDRDNVLRLLFRQIQKPHSRIRCNVVKVIKFLTTETLQGSLAVEVQDNILLHLQDILPFCIPTTSFDEALPPPESAAIEMQKEMLEMLFRWERKGVCATLSSQAWGQLASVMRYLRTPLKQSGGTVRLKNAAHMLEALEREENQRHRRAQMADAVIRRRVLAARDAYREHHQFIAENLESLEGVLKLLVPDPFHMEDLTASGASSPSDYREHGFHTSGEVNITFSLNFTRAAVESDLLLPEVQLKLNDDVRILRDSGREFTSLAMKHRAVVSEYLEACISFGYASLELSSIFTDDKEELELILARLNKAVNQFSAVHFVEELSEASTTAIEEEVEEDDFVEVPPLSLPSDQRITLTPEREEVGEIKKKDEDHINMKPLVILTDKLPWELRGHPSSSLSKHLQNLHRGGPARPLGKSRKHLKELRRELPEGSIILPSEETGSQKQRVRLESFHRFWKPIDVAEFEAPQINHLEAAISFSPSVDKPLPVKVVSAEEFSECMRMERMEEDQSCLHNINFSQAITKSPQPDQVNSKAGWRRVVGTAKQPLKHRRHRCSDLVDVSKIEKAAIRPLRHQLLHS
ncbi:unnamed protein product [Hydatigera taeniaeformis]|uniref:SOSS complex subunit A homolog n=1 Tax=Hydatigena taeniaeformis TaxID=6205 RepID=A0A0R3WIW9_HYDTA|nr:unnamed protein product [Hydatigera taeniaeformis]